MASSVQSKRLARVWPLLLQELARSRRVPVVTYRLQYHADFPFTQVQRLLPGGKVVDPRVHGIDIPSKLSDGKAPTPAVVAERRERHFVPVSFVAVRYSNAADRTSCPSVKMSASTTTRSPAVRLIGKRPPSTSGVTPSMMTRCVPALFSTQSSFCRVHSMCRVRCCNGFDSSRSTMTVHTSKLYAIGSPPCAALLCTLA
jgi:hypothetical protein